MGFARGRDCHEESSEAVQEKFAMRRRVVVTGRNGVTLNGDAELPTRDDLRDSPISFVDGNLQWKSIMTLLNR